MYTAACSATDESERQAEPAIAVEQRLRASLWNVKERVPSCWFTWVTAVMLSVPTNSSR